MFSPRFTLIAFVAFLSLSSLHEAAASHHHKKGSSRRVRKVTTAGAGQISNTAVAATIEAQATELIGDYYFQNVATSLYLTWSIHPQTIAASAGSAETASVMTLTTWQAGTRVHPRASNGKCLAAQFSGSEGVDDAATMYECATDESRSDDAGNPQAKQQWHFVPTGTQDTYHIIPHDHINDMETRALSSASLTTAGGYISTALELYDSSDEKQMWVVTVA